MAIAYFRGMLGIGLELLTITLMVGIATSVIDGFYNRVNGKSVYELLLVFCVCAVLALLINKIPARVAALGGGGSGANVGAGSVVGAAAMSVAALATAGSAIATGAAGVAGGAQALMAAYSKASAAGGSDGGSGGGMSDLVRSAGGAEADGGHGSAGGESGSGSPLANAMGDSDNNSQFASGQPGSSFSASSSDSDSGGHANDDQAQKKSGTTAAAGASKAGKLAIGTATNLMKGTWDVAKENFSDRVGSTTGGKIAAAINARATSAQGQDDKPAFENNTLSAGVNSADAAAEIAAFRDRNSNTG